MTGPAASRPEIRVAGARDAAVVVALVAAFRDHLGASSPTDDDLRRFVPDSLADPSIEFCCAWLEGQPVGYTQTRFFHSLWAPGVEALLEDLFVQAAARGRTVGRTLLRHALERATRRGARVLGLHTNERNAPAQRLYLSEGLRPQGHARWREGREVRWVKALVG
jgi:GNAT superfamily N-acetyltransferase